MIARGRWFDSVILNGSVGTGKTTTAEAVGDLLRQRGVSGAVIDVDWLRRSWPAPRDAPFHAALALDNLRAVATNFRRYGAQVLVVASVVEDPDELARTAAALGVGHTLHVLLESEPAVVLERLRHRHAHDDESFAWHAHRHPELAQILATAGFTDHLRVDTTRAPVMQIAHQVVDALSARHTDRD